MQEINDQVDGQPSNPDGVLTADEFNKGIKRDLQATVTQTNQTFDANDATQLGQAMAQYGSGGDFYTATGVDEIVLTPTGSKVAPEVYVEGQLIRFTPANVNTGSVLVQAGGGNIALFLDGSALTGGELSTNYEIMARYDSANNRFNIINTFVNDFKSTTARIGFDDPVLNGFGQVSALQTAGATGQDSSTMAARFSADTAGPLINLYKSRSGDPSAFGNIRLNDIVGQFVWSADTTVASVPKIDVLSRILSTATLEVVSGAGYDISTSLDFRCGGDQATFQMTDAADFICTRPTKGGLGNSSFIFKDVWATDTTINSSDEKLKQFYALDDDEIAALGDVPIEAYKWNSAIDEKGEDGAKIHLGVRAQNIKAIPNSEKRGMLVNVPSARTEVGFDEYGKLADIFVKDEDGNQVYDETMSIRPIEILFGMVEDLRRKNAALVSRLEILENA